MYVLDATALRSGRTMPAPEELCTVPPVVEEVRLGPEARSLDYLISAGMKVVSPSEGSMSKVRQGARDSGDTARLSRADLELLALALELGAVLITDDYSIQNTARLLGIEYLPLAQRGITEVRKWRAKCSGCRRTFDEPVPECPVCGSEVRVGKKKVEKEKKGR